MCCRMILHEPTREYVYPLERNLLAIRLRTAGNAGASCTLYYRNRLDKAETGMLGMPMACYARDNMFDYYEAVIASEGAVKYIDYCFRIESGGFTFWLNNHGILERQPDSGLFKYVYTNENDVFRVPDWVKGSVIYQIFPDRFWNGDTSNDPENTENWDAAPTRSSFMGGNIKGIAQKLDYLQELGINTISLNPIFEAPSNHKYDTVDYYKIDPCFGSPEDFENLVQACHSRGLRIILDGVFNHIGYYSPQFQDVVKKGDNSPYGSWFYIDSYPVDCDRPNYETIGGYGMMPKLRLGNQAARRYILDAASYWVKEYGIDGWRLDTADEMDFTFLQELRKTIKNINKDCFLIGETWHENRDMLRGDQVDSLMNYPFKDAIVHYFALHCINSCEFDARINRIIGVYPSTVHNAMFNIIDSHDTPRFLTMCGGNRNRMKLAVAFQFLTCGIPVIYYGDEVGMQGGDDPDCRRAMVWDKERKDMDLFEWYRKMIDIRKRRKAIREGAFKTNLCSDTHQVYGFIREFQGERVYVVLNNSSCRAVIKLPVLESGLERHLLEDEISGNTFKINPIDEDEYYNDDITCYRGMVVLKLEPYQTCVLCRQVTERSNKP